MSAAPRVSVVMPYLRAESTIGRAIDSVLAQTMPDVELVAVSDGSTDGSAGIVADRARRDPRVRPLALDRNRGPAYARNRGIDAARGTWIAVVDADDWYAPGRLAALVEAGRDAIVVVDDLMGIDPLDETESGPLYPALPPTLTAEDVVAHTAPGARYNYGYLKPMVRRNFLGTHGLRYDETLRVAEDMLFLLECALLSGPIRAVPEAGYRYRLQVSPKSGRLSTATHSTPRDREVADALRALAARRGDRLTPSVRAAIDARCDTLARVADVSSFRHALFKRRFVDAAGLAVRSSEVRGYLWEKLRGASRA